MNEIRFDKSHEGLMASVNGGYLSGVLARARVLGGVTTTRLRRPVPLGESVYLYADEASAAIRFCDRTLAELAAGPEEVAETGFVTVEEARHAVDPEVRLDMFGDCFVCGRGAPEGLGVEPKRLDDGRFAAMWLPAKSDLIEDELVPEEYLHAALDCIGGFAALTAAKQPAVTGSLTVRVDYLAPSDQLLIVVGAAGRREGRKLHATSTIYAENDEVVATAEAIWVAIDNVDVGRAA